MNLPKISIVMPVLNAGRTLDKALRSIVQQNYPFVELIVLDGGSTDNTLTIIQQYADTISFWRSKKDHSPTAATNEGIRQATGDLIAILMGDDWYEPSLFHQIAKYYLNHPDADMFTCGGRIVRALNSQQYTVVASYTSSERLTLNIKNICFDISSAICCRFIKKSLYERIGYFDEQDYKGQHILSNDKTFLLHAYFADAKNIFVPFMGHNYLAHPGSSTFGQNRANVRRLCEEHMLTVDTLLMQPNGSFLDRCKLNYWHMDQSIRLLLFNLLDKAWLTAFLVLKNALKRNSIVWLIIFPVVFARILIKKLLRASKNLLKKQAVLESFI